MTKKHPTIGARTAALVRDELVPIMKAAGFKKSALVFRRTHASLQQVVQIYCHWTVSGGASPPKGTMYIWIGCDPRTRKPLTESACAVHFRPTDLVDDVRDGWPVPLSRGKQRVEVVTSLVATIRTVIAQLDQLDTEPQVRDALACRRAARLL